MSSITVNMLPGMRIAVNSFVSSIDASGFFAATQAPMNGGLVPTTNGFVVEDETIGSLSPGAEGSGASIVYTHHRPLQNTIFFFAETGEIGTVNIINVPVHDHSSIVQGGPAYGTYFSDDETEDTE